MNNDLIHINTLPPFKRMCVSIGNLPTSFMESMTYYEALEWLYKYLADTIIPTVNNTGEAVTELQTAFITLKDYVYNYFENLDVQEEINNKLDAMAESGELTDIIAQYLGLAGMITFNTVSEMKLAENLVNGSKCSTFGYYSVNDGGKALYKVRTITNEDVVDEASIIALHDNSLIAELVPNNEVNPEIFGCKGDGTTDDTTNFQKCLTYAENNKLIVCAKKEYLITNNLSFNGVIKGYSIGKIKTNGNSRIAGAFINADNNLIVDGLNFDCSSTVPFNESDKFLRYNNAIRCNNASIVNVKNCKFNNLYNIFIEITGDNTDNVNIENNLFSSDNKTNIYMSPMISVSLIDNQNAIIKINNNEFKGYSYTYVSAIDNDTNCNASGLAFANVIPSVIDITNNIFEDLGKYGSTQSNLGYSRLCVIDFYYNVHNINITNNIIKNCHWTALRLHGTNNVLIENNDISINRVCSESIVTITDTYNTTGEAPTGCDNIRFINNIFTAKEITEQGLYITGYGSYNSTLGIYGSITNFLFENNKMDYKFNTGILFDCSLKTAYIQNNFFNLYGKTGQTAIKANDATYIVSSLTGVDYSSTIMNITDNIMRTSSACIYNRGRDSSQDALFDLMTLAIQNNDLKSTGNQYVIYGTTTGALGTAIKNLLYGYGGFYSIKNLYNNVVFYNSASAGHYNQTVDSNNNYYTV